MTIPEMIAIPSRAHHEHFTDGQEGLDACPATNMCPGPCDCGADETNAEIDAVIAALREMSSLTPVV